MPSGETPDVPENPDDRPSARRRPRRDDDLDEVDDDRPRRRRPRRDDDLEDDLDDDRPHPRRRRPRRDDDYDDYDDDDASDDGLHYVIPINTSGLAIAAGYMGLFSVLCLPAPIALILGILALRTLRKNPKLHGQGRAIFAIVMGAIFTITMLAVGIFAMIHG